MSTVTKAQQRMIARLRRALSIHKGVNWYAHFPGVPGKNRTWSYFIDGRTCNALERAGILLHSPTEEHPNRYVLNEEIVEKLKEPQ